METFLSPVAALALASALAAHPAPTGDEASLTTPLVDATLLGDHGLVIDDELEPFASSQIVVSGSSAYVTFQAQGRTELWWTDGDKSHFVTDLGPNRMHSLGDGRVVAGSLQREWLVDGEAKSVRLLYSQGTQARIFDRGELLVLEGSLRLRAVDIDTGEIRDLGVLPPSDQHAGLFGMENSVVATRGSAEPGVTEIWSFARASGEDPQLLAELRDYGGLLEYQDSLHVVHGAAGERRLSRFEPQGLVTVTALPEGSLSYDTGARGFLIQSATSSCDLLLGGFSGAAPVTFQLPPLEPEANCVTSSADERDLRWLQVETAGGSALWLLDLAQGSAALVDESMPGHGIISQAKDGQHVVLLSYPGAVHRIDLATGARRTTMIPDGNIVDYDVVLLPEPGSKEPRALFHAGPRPWEYALWAERDGSVQVLQEHPIGIEPDSFFPGDFDFETTPRGVFTPPNFGRTVYRLHDGTYNPVHIFEDDYLFMFRPRILGSTDDHVIFSEVGGSSPGGRITAAPLDGGARVDLFVDTWLPFFSTTFRGQGGRAFLAIDGRATLITDGTPEGSFTIDKWLRGVIPGGSEALLFLADEEYGDVVEVALTTGTAAGTRRFPFQIATGWQFGEFRDGHFVVATRDGAVLTEQRFVFDPEPRLEPLFQRSTDTSRTTRLRGRDLWWDYSNAHRRLFSLPTGRSADEAVVLFEGDGNDITSHLGLRFFRSSSDQGPQLWTTDGTPEGTRQIEQLGPAATFSDVFTGNRGLDGNVLLSLRTESTGVEVFRTDGSPGGLELVADVEPGPRSSWPSLYVAAATGDQIVFAANRSDVGVEAFTVPRTPLRSACREAPHRLCLRDGRFAVEVEWFGRDAGQRGRAQAVPLNEVSGGFTFFAEDNLELVVKVLDGSNVNDADWVFFGGLTTLDAFVTVIDHWTGKSQTYRRQAGSLCGLAAIDAFPRREVDVPWAETTSPSATSLVASAMSDENGGCADGSICLQGGRFAVRAEAALPAGGTLQATPGFRNSASGAFSLFDTDNLELLVKVVQAPVTAGEEPGYWVFVGKMSDLEATVHVADRETGRDATMVLPAGELCGAVDFETF